MTSGSGMNNVYADPEAARRYNAARHLPQETKTLWLDGLKALLPEARIGKCLDLGCGTGRFTAALASAFDCPVVGVEPSQAMLDVARSEDVPGVEWKQGSAEDIPLASQSVGLVFMSQVFHHLTRPDKALTEIHRVLTPGGFLIIRNGTLENNEETEWLHCFPEALEIDSKRILSRRALEELVCAQPFDLIAQQTFRQLFAADYEEYYEKIGGRGLSSLIALSDEAFGRGMARFREWIDGQAADEPVFEPVDAFVFRKRGEQAASKETA